MAWKGKYEGEFCSLYFACFSRARPLTPQCGIELEKEASWAAEASQVEVQHWKGRAEASQVEVQCWKEKTKGESRSLCLICFSCVRPLTARCGTELEKEASRAAEASRVEVQHWKERVEAS